MMQVPYEAINTFTVGFVGLLKVSMEVVPSWGSTGAFKAHFHRKCLFVWLLSGHKSI